LLTETAQDRDCFLVPKRECSVAGGKRVGPDGTLLDAYDVARGYWEAKDTNDDLEAEIGSKIAKHYPLTNTIFEDTTRAVLYQHGRRVGEFDLSIRSDIHDLLERFYGYVEPDLEGFNRAVVEFRERVPALAKALTTKVTAARTSDQRFRAAFEHFVVLCRAALNPNIRTETVAEMLVQHLMTERLFRKVFRDEEFTRRNVIAAEVEKVVDALVGRSFSRADYLKSLDPFYKAIERTADTIDDFQGKQHFLNTVYERFFQGFSAKAADVYGVVYTPQPIVDFMCTSVEEVLKAEFGQSLGAPGVTVLDPCTGTGNFLVNILRRVPGRQVGRVYREQLFANEVMLLPYYIAALNIEHAYFEKTGEYAPFEGLCFIDTLELAEPRQPALFPKENAERVQRQRKTPITVVIGNPPYNASQGNENDDNRNRKYEVIDERIRQTYVKDSTATLRAQVYDPYVKFFRWATDRLGSDGIVCLVTNNSFVDQVSFDGMRKHLMRDFTRVYHLHLCGNVRHDPHLSGTQYNVFGIQVGVGITIAVKSRAHRDHKLFFHRVDKNLRREEKCEWLAGCGAMSRVPWQELTPDERHTWLVVANSGEFSRMMPLGNRQTRAAINPEAVFRSYSSGLKSNSDAYVYDHNRDRLVTRAENMVEDFNSQLDRWRRKTHSGNLEQFLKVDPTTHKWIRKTKRVFLRGRHLTFSESSVREVLYRPYVKKWHFFDRHFDLPQGKWTRS